MTVTTIHPRQLDERRQAGTVDLIDVRTPAEFREVHVEFARNVPLDRLNPAELTADRNGSPLYFICKSGTRGRQACERMNRLDPALAMYLLLIGQHPTSEHLPAALLAAARLHGRLEQHEQALALYERLQREFGDRPESDVVLYESSWTLRNLGRDDAADELLNRLHDQFPQSPRWADATYRLAERAYLRKDLAPARALLALDPVVNSTWKNGITTLR